jgi:hypothetical protein
MRGRQKHALSLSNWVLKTKRAPRKFWLAESKWPEADFPGDARASEQALFSLSLSSSYEVDEQQSALLGLYEAFGPVEVAAHNETHIS